MGKPVKHQPVKLITGLIFQDEGSLVKTLGILRLYFGAIDFESQPMAFTYTDYYEREMGKNLKKKIVSFSKPIAAERLAQIKILTNKIETKLAGKNGKRRVNIDPGYLTMAKLILASTKDYSHRVYLDKGIFAEITLTYRGKSFQPEAWTYPDYRTPEYISVFNRIRELYAKQIS